MSQSQRGSPATADASASASKVKAQQTHKAQQNDRALSNRAKAQQNKERAAAQARARNAPNVAAAAQDKSGPVASTTQGRRSKPPTLAPPSQAGAKQSTKQATKEAPKAKAKVQPPRQTKATPQFKSKVVIRRLPPNLPAHVFWKAVSPWIRDSADCQALTTTAQTSSAPAQPGAETSEAHTSDSRSAATSSASTSPTPTVDYKQFVAGKLKTDTNKQNKHARAYVRFLDAQMLVQFYKAFDGHIFRDSRGNESIAIVEFAPYQKVVVSTPRTGTRGGPRAAKPDAQQGTIDKDADYQCFLERLSKADDQVQRSEGELLASLLDSKGKEKETEARRLAGKVTPLLLHLREQKMAQSDASTRYADKMQKAADKPTIVTAARSAGVGVTGGPSVAAVGAEDKVRAKTSTKDKKDTKDKLDKKDTKDTKDKRDKKDKAKAVAPASEEQAKLQEAEKDKSSRKETRKKRTGKRAVDADGAATPSRAQAAHVATRKAATCKTATKNRDTSASTSAHVAEPLAHVDTAKPNTRPPRRKAPPKNTHKSSTGPPSSPAAASSSKLHIL